MSPPPAPLESLFAGCEGLSEEVRRTLLTAERLHAANRGDPGIAPWAVAGPYILALERELIQFVKQRLGRFVTLRHPSRPLESWTSSYGELADMLRQRERIGLGHFTGWMDRLHRERDDALFLELRAFFEALDPAAEFFNPAVRRVLSEQIVPFRKACVHIQRLEKWPDWDDVETIRRIVLLDADGRGEGLLPRYVRLQANLERHMGASDAG